MKFPQGKAFSFISISIFICFTLNSIFDFCFHHRFCWKKKIQKLRNNTVIPEFILLAISDNPEFQVVTFIFLFLSYLLSVTGNLTIIMLTWLDSCLKRSMYFFLQNFSFLEIIFTSVSNPRFLWSIITKVQTMSYNNCLAQLFFFISMVSLKSFFWLLCPMIVMLPSASLCLTPPSWIGKFAPFVSSLHGWQNFWPFSYHSALSSS
jgi:hypothetical protein